MIADARLPASRARHLVHKRRRLVDVPALCVPHLHGRATGSKAAKPTFWFQPLYRWIAGGPAHGVRRLQRRRAVLGCRRARWPAPASPSTSPGRGRISLGAHVAGSIGARSVDASARRGISSGAGSRRSRRWVSFTPAALFAMRGRHGSWPHILMAGALATLAFFTRLNNLPMTLAVAAFAWPTAPADRGFVPPAAALRAVSRRALAGMLGVIALGLCAVHRAHVVLHRRAEHAAWHAGRIAVGLANDHRRSHASENVVGSVLMVLTMNDPPRFDVRALPLMAGVVAALFAAAPASGRSIGCRLALVALCLAGMSGAFVARGTAYPGRFSVHLIPAAVALTVVCVRLSAQSAARPDLCHQRPDRQARRKPRRIDAGRPGSRADSRRRARS